MIEFLADPPPWMRAVAAVIVGFTLVWIAVSFYAGPVNQGL